MVLVDTSVWVRFLAGKSPFADRLDSLLAKDEVAGHPLIFGELLVGDRGQRAQLLRDYERMSQVAVVPHADVVTFVRDGRLQGRGVGWIDVHLLAAARLEGLLLWTADVRLAEVADDLNLNFTWG